MMTRNRNDGLHNGGNSMIAKSKAPESAKMTEEEIVRNFKQAKNKREQIKILADLNCTSRGEIEETLKKNGVSKEELPAKPGRKAKKEEIPEAVREACGKEMVNLQMDIDKNTDTIRDLQQQNRELEAKMIQIREFCA